MNDLEMSDLDILVEYVLRRINDMSEDEFRSILIDSGYDFNGEE